MRFYKFIFNFLTGVESLHSNPSRKRSPRPKRKKSSGSEQSVKSANKPPSKTKTSRPNSPAGVKQIFPVLKHNPGLKQTSKQGAKPPSPKTTNPGTKQNNQGLKQTESPPQERKFNSILDLRKIISKVKVSLPDVRVDKIESPKLKLKNRGVLTKEIYPAVVSEKNKQTYIDAAKVWKTPAPEAEKITKDLPGPSTTQSKRKALKVNPARSLKLKVRKKLWDWSKHTLRDNERWSNLFKENAIDVDKINIDKLDLSLINMDALGIENKFVKRTVEWLLK